MAGISNQSGGSMFTYLFMVVVCWILCINIWFVKCKDVYLRNGEVIRVNTPSAWRWVSLASCVYITASFIFKYVI